MWKKIGEKNRNQHLFYNSSSLEKNSVDFVSVFLPSKQYTWFFTKSRILFVFMRRSILDLNYGVCVCGCIEWRREFLFLLCFVEERYSYLISTKERERDSFHSPNFIRFGPISLVFSKCWMVSKKNFFFFNFILFSIILY